MSHPHNQFHNFIAVLSFLDFDRFSRPRTLIRHQPFYALSPGLSARAGSLVTIPPIDLSSPEIVGGVPPIFESLINNAADSWLSNVCPCTSIQSNQISRLDLESVSHTGDEVLLNCMQHNGNWLLPMDALDLSNPLADSCCQDNMEQTSWCHHVIPLQQPPVCSRGETILWSIIGKYSSIK